jgi:2-methylisocitrate lyase-like PEP mutase family enzyme
MSNSIFDKATRFRALHAGPRVFVIPNPWDGGSARLLESLGFQALATSSAAAAMTLGRRDYHISREEALAMARVIVEATDLPVSADLENGFGDAPEFAAETIRLAGEIGLAGGSIEDSKRGGASPIYDLAHAVERVAAAAKAARALPFPFVFTARAEGLLHGQRLEDVIVRLQAYEKAGADVLFAPGLKTIAEVRAVCAAVGKPINFMGGMPGAPTIADLEAAGVRRISLATSLYRAAMTGLRDAARDVMQTGTLGFTDRIMPSAELNPVMRG